jgi:hypothetical protein
MIESPFARFSRRYCDDLLENGIVQSVVGSPGELWGGEGFRAAL